MPAKKIKSAGGFGPSKTFNCAEGSLGVSAVDRMLQYHINGVQIGEMNLDPAVLSALDFFATDEGIAEKNARPNVRAENTSASARDVAASALAACAALERSRASAA